MICKISAPICFAFLLSFVLLSEVSVSAQEPTWEIGPFVKADAVNPILSPTTTGVFLDPMSGKQVAWQQDNVFNPAAVVRNKRIALLFRAEDDFGQGVGHHTSRIGFAESKDGLHFTTAPAPVIFPDIDDQRAYDWPGGDEDPRVVETDKHGYVMTYTSWNGDLARLNVATSDDLVNWTKQGPAFALADGGKYLNTWSKSGSIVTRQDGDHLIAVKIAGQYWMLFGEGTVCAAISTDLIHWTPVQDSSGNIVPVLAPRPGLFDSTLAEAGPPAVVTPAGIVFIYNGKGDNGAYSGGQALLDLNDPTHVLDRPQSSFIKPERPYETSGQYAAGTVFLEGLVHFRSQWYLYYGTADSHVAVAVTPKQTQREH